MKQLTKQTLYYLLHLIAKSIETKKDDILKEYFEITKDAAAAIETLRFNAGVSEIALAEALGVKADEYLKFVESGNGLSITAAGIKAVAKLLKMTVEELAAKMVEGDAPAEGDGTGDGSGSGNQSTPPGAVDPTKSATTPLEKNGGSLRTGQVIHIKQAGGTSGNAVFKSAEELKENTIALAKMALTGLRTSLDVRKDAILPADFAPGGVLQPEQSSNIIDLMVDQSSFLQKINVVKLMSKKQDVPVFDITGRNLKRLTTGWAASDANRTKGTTDFVRFDANKCNLEFIIDNDTIALHQGNLPGLENFIYQRMMMKVKNEIVDLIINGTTDSTDAEELVWTELATGYITLAIAGCAAGQKVNTTPLTTVQSMYAALVDAQVATNERFYSSDQVLICGMRDMRTYITELNARNDGLTTIVGNTESLRQYDGHKIEPTDFIATDYALFTKYSNLYLGIVSGPNEGIYVERHAVPGGILFRVTFYLDPAIGNYKAMNVARPV